MTLSLSKYHQAALQHVEELRLAFTVREQAYIRLLLADMGSHGWDAWVYEHEDEILRFLKLTPSARKRRKAWQEEPLRCLLAFAAFQQARLNCAVFDGLHQAALQFPDYAESPRASIAYIEQFHGFAEISMREFWQTHWWAFPELEPPFSRC